LQRLPGDRSIYSRDDPKAKTGANFLKRLVPEGNGSDDKLDARTLVVRHDRDAGRSGPRSAKLRMSELREKS
jgi:hypothetical protein